MITVKNTIKAKETISFKELMKMVDSKGKAISFIGSIQLTDFSGLFLATYGVVLALDGSNDTWGTNVTFNIDKWVDLEIIVK